MSEKIVNRRKFLEAANALAKTNAPNEQHITEVFRTLSAILTDLAGEQVTVVMYAPELDPSHPARNLEKP
jgi:hypothetical protein